MFILAFFIAATSKTPMFQSQDLQGLCLRWPKALGLFEAGQQQGLWPCPAMLNVAELSWARGSQWMKAGKVWAVDRRFCVACFFASRVFG